MLGATEVIPFLQHARPDVRALALHYLSEANDPSPATADDLWAAIDRFGGGEYSCFYVALQFMPQTEQSLLRTLKELENKPDENLAAHLENALAKTSYGLLLRTRDLIEQTPVLSPGLRKHLEQRFALAQVPREQLLDRLIAFAVEKSEKDELPEEFDDRHADRLIEAVARHPESAPWAISTLNDGQIVDWREIYAVDLLGHMRFRPASELLVDKLMEDDTADFLLESATTALVHVGSAEVVRIVRERFGKMPWGIKLHAADILGRIKLPQSESALVDCFDHEQDRSIRTRIAESLCDLCASESASLSRLRDLINRGNWDITMIDLNHDVAALFTLLGQEVPELDRWRQSAANKQARRQERQQEYAKFFGNAFADPSAKAAATPDESAVQTESPLPSPTTIRRDSPKVGRNDPCPCGSGKKYKKCCGK